MQTTATIVSVDTFPQDFQQLLSDLWLESRFQTGCETWLPPEVAVFPADVDEFRQEVLENCGHFTMRDWQQVNEFTTAIPQGVKLPPLICEGPFLRDGYHRVTACYLLGMETFPAIDISNPGD